MPNFMKDNFDKQLLKFLLFDLRFYILKGPRKYAQM